MRIPTQKLNNEVAIDSIPTHTSSLIAAIDLNNNGFGILII